MKYVCCSSEWARCFTERSAILLSITYSEEKPGHWIERLQTVWQRFLHFGHHKVHQIRSCSAPATKTIGPTLLQVDDTAHPIYFPFRPPQRPSERSNSATATTISSRYWLSQNSIFKKLIRYLLDNVKCIWMSILLCVVGGYFDILGRTPPESDCSYGQKAKF